MAELAVRFQALYVKIMIWLIGRLLEAASRVDGVIQQELQGLPAGFTYSMGVLPAGPEFIVKKQDNGTFYCKRRKDSFTADLKVLLKHVKHAFLIFSFQESTARSFANDRILLDGEIHLAMIMVRCLDRMEVLVLPKFIARRAVKRYPPIPLPEKLWLAIRIYLQMLIGLVWSRHV